jgi:hypothetical protein
MGIGKSSCAAQDLTCRILDKWIRCLSMDLSDKSVLLPVDSILSSIGNERLLVDPFKSRPQMAGDLLGLSLLGS